MSDPQHSGWSNFTDEDRYYYNPDDNSEDGSLIEDREYSDLFDPEITADFRRINNIQTVYRIIRTIERKLNRQLLDNERQSVRQMINNVTNPAYNYRFDPTLKMYMGNLQNWSDNDIVNHMADRWVNIFNIKSKDPPGIEITDIRTMLRDEIGTTSESGAVYSPTFIQPAPDVSDPVPPQPDAEGILVDKFLGKSNRYDLLTLLNPNALLSYNYIYLDTRQRNLSASAGINTFVWNEDNTANTGQGNFTYLGVVRDIVQIRVMPFRIPYPSDGSADNGFRQINLSFEEFRNQAYIGRNNRRFHIIFDVTIDGTYIELDPYEVNNGDFNFDKPITTLNQLTVSFGNPINIINFDVDRLFCAFTYGAVTTVSFTEDHNLVTGDTVSFTDFNTADPSTDAPVIAEMNSTLGHIITKLNDLEFEIAVDTSTITPIPDLNIVCIFDSKTFQIPIQLTFIRPDEGAYEESYWTSKWTG